MVSIALVTMLPAFLIWDCLSWHADRLLSLMVIH